MLPDLAHVGLVGLELQRADHADAADQPGDAGALGLQERALQRVVDAPGFLAEREIALGLARAGERANGVRRLRAVGKQVEPLLPGPGVAGQRRGGPQREVVVERRGGVVEQSVEHPAHGEHGRPGIDRAAPHRDFAHLAARRGGAFQHRDRHARNREVDGSGQAAQPGADDDGSFHDGEGAPVKLCLTHVSGHVDTPHDNQD